MPEPTSNHRLLVITGGTKGIGRAMLERFAAEGFDVATTARTGPALEALAEAFAAAFPQQKLYTWAADLGVPAEIQAFAGFVLSLERPIEVLVNNTGTFLPGQILTEAPGTFEHLMAVNVGSAYHLSRALLPGMVARQQGFVANVCSTASLVAYTNGGSYCMSKFALLALSKLLREELKPHGIGVTALLPGATYTDSWAGSGLPPERFMQPADVAELLWAAYRVSPGAVVEEILLRPLAGDLPAE